MRDERRTQRTRLLLLLHAHADAPSPKPDAVSIEDMMRATGIGVHEVCEALALPCRLGWVRGSNWEGVRAAATYELTEAGTALLDMMQAMAEREVL